MKIARLTLFAKLVLNAGGEYSLFFGMVRFYQIRVYKTHRGKDWYSDTSGPYEVKPPTE